MEGHIVYAAKKHFKMSSLDDDPETLVFPDNFGTTSASDRKKYLYKPSEEMIQQLVSL